MNAVKEKIKNRAMMGVGHSDTMRYGSRSPVIIILSETFHLRVRKAKLEKLDQKFTCEGCN